nr:MAG: D-alanyl-D-alanine carboxypeptidase [Bacillota bacterium]
MDWQTGQVLHAREALAPRPPASTTKILTALIALERGRLSDRVTISRRAAATPGSSMSLRAGEVYTLHDLLRGLLLRSGNDAAVAIAEHIAGSVEAFAALMNERARELGARQSRFLNPHGLHQPGHYSTAYDLALIARHALAHPVFADLVRQREALVGEGARTRVLSNTNRLLWHLPGADGVKTGTTSAAGECLVASATRPDPETGLEQKLIAVVLDADARWEDSAELLNWGFEHFRLVPVASPGDGLWEVPVRGGREPRIRVAPAAPLAVVVPRSLAGEPVLTLRLPPAAPAPVRPGTPLGTAEVAWGDWVLHQVPLVAAEEVVGAGWATWLVRPALPWLRWLGRQGWV